MGNRISTCPPSSMRHLMYLWFDMLLSEAQNVHIHRWAGRWMKSKGCQRKRPTAVQISTHQHETSHPWLEVFAGGRRTQHVFYHLHTQTAGFRRTWWQNVGCLAARKAARPTRGYHCDWLGYRVVCREKKKVKMTNVNLTLLISAGD